MHNETNSERGYQSIGAAQFFDDMASAVKMCGHCGLHPRYDHAEYTDSCVRCDRGFWLATDPDEVIGGQATIDKAVAECDAVIAEEGALVLMAGTAAVGKVVAA